MLRIGAVSPRFQPIVRLPGGPSIGHELLGRGAFPGLPESPLELFAIAEHLGLEVPLSQLFRRVGVAESKRLKNRGMLFINMHPAEIELAPLLAALKELRVAEPSAPLALELHEKTVTDAIGMTRPKAALQDMQIQLAYDDFGAGQARLLELMQAPPDFLKFDISLIRDIHLQPPRSRQVIKTLVDIAKDLGIATLAEGVEVAEEAEVCVDLGFELAQGYFYSRPFQLPEP
jgi:EAL domain-containing protein (putative c-di-GMP-specific phosphodiesterase class I)